MGFLRFLLALSVVITHSYPIFGFHMINGNLAVSAFFVISGFYMSLLLHRKYVGKNKSYFLFISNRFLRIYPVYWIGLVTLLGASVVKFFFTQGSDITIQQQLHYYSQLPVWFAVLKISEDVMRNFTLIITTDYFYTNSREPVHLLIQQAWSLQAELIFYLIAPFIFKRNHKRLLMAILVLGIAHLSIIYFHITPLNNLTWIIFDKLIFFLLGGVSYLIYLKIVTWRISIKVQILLYCLLIFCVVTFAMLPFFSGYGYDSIFVTIIMLMVPFAFLFSHKNSFDRWLGELSYPIYIMHSLVIKLLQSSSYFMSHYSLLTLAAISLTIFVSYLLIRYVEIPIDRIRQSRLR